MSHTLIRRKNVLVAQFVQASQQADPMGLMNSNQNDIALLTTLAGLLHDLGKACRAFQMRLHGQLTERNQYRHEWVSLRLFEAFVGGDDDARWLARLAAPSDADDGTWLGRLKRDGLDDAVSSPFVGMAHAPLAQAVGWLILTHHMLPALPRSREDGFQSSQLINVLQQVDPDWNACVRGGQASLYWDFPHGLPVTTDLWREQAASLAQRMQMLCSQPGQNNWLSNPYTMHIARLCLMLADHQYSRLSGDDAGRLQGVDHYPLYANTQAGILNQRLDEHLLGVARNGAQAANLITQLEGQLPRMCSPAVLGQHTQNPRFEWQNKASETASAMRERAARQGAFIVNMASTGCGKTLGNARIMHALSDPQRGMRCAFAMGLRTLTLQTGRAFHDLLGLGDEELAVRVGAAASRELFEHYEQQAEASGSASSQSLLDENAHIQFKGNSDACPALSRILSDPQVRSLVVAPLLVCTIDHLTPATESERGGRQIAPMLRLMSGDLVLDEPDDFDINDLPALTRLVHWAGLLGSRVLLSSATLPPALVQGLFEAYRNGRQHFERNQAERPEVGQSRPEICCAWFDEFNQMQADCADAPGFVEAHTAFAAKRHDRLKLAQVLRRCRLLPLPIKPGTNRQQHAKQFAAIALKAALELHGKHHSVDPHSAKRVSFGLIRMANIEPLSDVALALYQLGAPAGVRIHLCTYHSQFPLLIRSSIERQLDQALNRRQPEAVFELPDIRQRLDGGVEEDHIFIVLGSSVVEVGRDHDYDWAIAEPSSMRSLIQLAGRVRRHRMGECQSPNLLIFDTNLRHFRELGRPAFCKPGFENSANTLESHFLSELLDPNEIEVIDARPRIVEAPLLNPRSRLIDLEHARIRQTMLVQVPAAPAPSLGRQRRVPTTAVLNAASWWQLATADALLTAVLPQRQPFRDDPIARVDLELRPDQGKLGYKLFMLMPSRERGRRHEKIEQMVDASLLDHMDDEDVQGPRIGAWGQMSYREALNDLAADLNLSLHDCARRFGVVTLPANPRGWRFHPALGFSKRR